MDISPFITHTQDYHTPVFFKDIFISTPSFSIFFKQNTNHSPRRGPQDLLVTHYDCEENEQKNATQLCYKASNTMRNRTSSYRNHKYNSNIILKSPSNNSSTVTGYKFTATFSEKKVRCSQVSNGNENRLDHESFYQSNIERLFFLKPDDCKTNYSD